MAFVGVVIFAGAFGFYMSSIAIGFMALGAGLVIIEVTSFFGKVLVRMSQKR